MKSVVGLLEYTVTGAFVWVLVAAFATVVGLDMHLGAAVAARLQELPKGLDVAKDLISLAVGGAFLVGVFATGALLDLVAPVVFIALEIGWAQKWMFQRGHRWMDRLVQQEGAIVASDYEMLVRNGGRKKPAIWVPLRYRRVTAFLFSYVLAGAKSPQVEDLLDRLKLWRVNQAIGLSLLLLTLALSAWAFISTYLVPQAALSAKELLMGVLLPAGLCVLSYVSMRLSFFRLVIALEAALYLTFTQSRRKAVDPAAVKVPRGVRSELAGTRPSLAKVRAAGAA